MAGPSSPGSADPVIASDRPTLLLVGVLLAGSALAACGERGASPASTGEEPLTPTALGAVVADRLGTPDYGRAADDLEELGRGVVGAEVRFGSTGEYDGDLLALAVAPRPPDGLFDCARGDLVPERSDCVDVGDGGRLFWERQEPEEDPGVIYLAVPKGDATVLVYQAGPDVTADPRELDLAVSVDDMLALAEDPRVDVTTSAEAVADGEDLAWWYDG